ncbi:MAG: hypothetical protein KKA81_13815 [Bacteroidetes bacterium]|nr:hypothetical protein [Bacteroidota bacterium]
MKPFLRGFLFWISFGALTIAGCSRIPAEQITSGVYTGRRLSPFPQDSIQRILGKGKFEILNQSFNGFMAVQRIDGNAFRINFSNEIGLTLFDISIWNDSIHVNHVLKNIDKPALIDKIGRFFKVFLLENERCSQCSSNVNARGQGYEIWKRKEGAYFSYDSEGNLLYKRIKTTSGKVWVYYHEYDSAGRFKNATIREKGLFKLVLEFNILKMN